MFHFHGLRVNLFLRTLDIKASRHKNLDKLRITVSEFSNPIVKRCVARHTHFNVSRMFKTSHSTRAMVRVELGYERLSANRKRVCDLDIIVRTILLQNPSELAKHFVDIFFFRRHELSFFTDKELPERMFVHRVATVFVASVDGDFLVSVHHPFRVERVVCLIHKQRRNCKLNEN